ncbi:MAG: hypothetical protein JSU65_11360 [Candidatus Zixiibacteriota bacterium]|nr:MAG: hypothetical protein JSU65_11360 [candidate division Zixibacteria bacterium]
MKRLSSSRGVTGMAARTMIVLAAVSLLVMVGCSNQPTEPEAEAVEIVTSRQITTASLSVADQVLETTAHMSPYMINLQSQGASESVLAIIRIGIPSGYRLTDYDFTLSFNGDDVIDAYRCVYCYIDDNLIISFAKDEVIASPVSIALANTVAEAGVNGYFRVESDSDGYDTQLSAVGSVEIISPAKK